MPGGRPSKLTPEVHAELCRLIGEVGLTQADAVRIVGISTTAFYGWVQKGKKAKSGKMKEFADDLERATAQFKERRHEALLRAATEESVEVQEEIRTGPDGNPVTHVKRIRRPPDPRWDAWLLERKFPEEYSRRYVKVDAKVKNEGPPGPLQVVIVDADDMPEDTEEEGGQE